MTDSGLQSEILLLDYDHTLYPASSATLKAVDGRITLYIQTFLGLAPDTADALRLRLCEEYGATLRGLELHHGVDREHYCDFIHAIDDALLPCPDPALERWLKSLDRPVYLFTNARKDWAVKGLRSMGLDAFLPVPGQTSAPLFRDIFDITFLDWRGKPHPEAYAKVEEHLRGLHGDALSIHFADDRPDNLVAAGARNWHTIWICPDEPLAEAWAGKFDKVVAALVQLDPESLA